MLTVLLPENDRSPALRDLLEEMKADGVPINGFLDRCSITILGQSITVGGCAFTFVAIAELENLIKLGRLCILIIAYGRSIFHNAENDVCRIVLFRSVGHGVYRIEEFFVKGNVLAFIKALTVFYRELLEISLPCWLLGICGKSIVRYAEKLCIARIDTAEEIVYGNIEKLCYGDKIFNIGHGSAGFPFLYSLTRNGECLGELFLRNADLGSELVNGFIEQHNYTS